MNFPSDLDKELLREIDRQYKSDFAGQENFEPEAFDVSKYNFKAESSLRSMSEEVLQLRTTLLVRFTRAFIKAAKFTNVADRDKPGTLAYNHFKGKGLVIPAIT